MASTPENRPEIRQELTKRADGGEPLYDEDMAIQRSGNSLVVGVTAFACKVHGIEKGDEPTVEVHDDGIWIATGDTDE